MKKYLLIYLLLFVVVFVTACEDRTDIAAPAAPSTGSANFTRFVAVGNSLTAGYQSSSLYQSAQEYSYAKLIADQVGTKFEYPAYSDPGTGGRLEVVSLTPFATASNPAKGVPLNLNYAAPYNNLGIPGAFLYDFLNAYDSTTCFTAAGGVRNPMFNLVLRNQGGTQLTQFLQLKAQSPTFIIFWLGNNDVLGFAASGGVAPITPQPLFSTFLKASFDSLASLGVPVVVGNLIDVTVTPLVTTVGGQLRQQGINAVFGVKGDGSVGLLDLTQNLLTLNASAELAAGKGTSPSNPLSNNVVLDNAEIVAIKTAVGTYNAMIQAEAVARNFVYTDINAEFLKFAAATQSAAGGIVIDGLKFSVIYLTGGLFSLDGVHPSNQGAAVIANTFISSINTAFGASIPKINLATIPSGLPLKTGPISIKDIKAPEFKYIF